MSTNRDPSAPAAPVAPGASASTLAGPDRRARRRRLLTRAALASVIALVLYTLVGFFVVPWVITGWIVPRIARTIDGTLTLAKARTNPFTFECVLEGLELKDSRGVRTFALDRFEGNLQTWPTLFSRGYTFERAVVTNPYIRAEVLESRVLNLDTILRPVPPDPNAKPKKPLERIPRIRVDRLLVAGGELYLRDSSLRQPFEASWSGLNLDITPLDLDPAFKSPTTIVATTSQGERLEVTAKLIADPPALEGEVRLDNLRLVAFMPYLREYAQGEVSDGRLSARLDFAFGPSQTPPLVTGHLHEARLENIEIREKAGADATQLVRVPLIRVVDARADAMARSLTVASVDITDATTLIERLADGSFSLQRAMLPELAPGEVPPPLELPYPIEAVRDGIKDFVASRPRVDPATITLPLQRLLAAVRNLIEDMGQRWDISLEKATVTNASTTWIDRATPSGRDATFSARVRSALIGPIRTREQFSTPIAADVAVGESGSLTLRTTIKPLSRSLEASAKLIGVDLAPFAPYTLSTQHDELGRVGIVGGTLALEGTATASLSDTNALALEWSGSAEIAQGAIAASPRSGPSPTTPLAWSRLAISGTPRASLSPAGDVALEWKGELTLDALRLDIPALARGELALASIKGDAAADLTSAATTGSFTGDALLRTLAASSDPAQLQRAALAELSLSGTAALEAPAASSAPSANRPALTWNGTTRLSEANAAGTMLGDLLGTIDAKVGSLIHTGTLRARQPDASQALRSLPLALTGDVSLDAVDVRVDRVAPPVIEQAALALGPTSAKGLAIDLDTMTIEASSIEAQRPRLEAATRLAPPTAAGSADSASRSNAGAGVVLPFSLKLGGVRITDGAATITDASGLPGPTSIVVDSAAATLSPIDSAAPGAPPITIALSANVAGSGTVTTTGTLAPFAPLIAADLTTTIKTLPLTPFDAYAGRFVGYTIDRGRMNMTLPIKLEDRKVSGALDFAFDGLYLGDSVKSPDAPDIPLKLGLALLRDSSDRVASRIPFAGDLTDPKLSLGGVIWQAFLGLIGKVVTAPFELLAAAFGAGEQDLSFVAFEPGTDTLAEGALARIDALSRALAERPTLHLSIRVLETPELDAAALRSIILREQLVAFRQANDPAGGTMTSLTPEQLASEIRRAYLLLLQTRSEPRPAEADLPDQAAMEAALAQPIEIPAERFAALRAARAERVVNLLTTEGKIDPARAKLPADAPEPAPKQPDSPRAVFELGTQ